jgi:predicted dehydrogenase
MLRFGISGCGGFMERGVLPLMQKVPGVEIVAVYDQNPAAVEKLGGLFGIRHRFKTFEDLVACPDVDVVYVASPNVFHKPQTLAAAKAGKHVFCQKPMAMNAGECRQMIRGCKAAGVKLGIGFCYPFAGPQQKVKQLIHQGAIGEVSYYAISYSLGGYTKESVGWRCDPKMSGGGPLQDVAPHLVNLGCFFLDDTVKSVMAYVRPDLTDTDIELDTVTVCEFSRGARGTIDTSFVRGHTHTYTVIGTAGEIRATNTMCWRVSGKITLQAGGKEQDVPFEPTEGIEEEIRAFAGAVEGGRDLPMPGEAGLHAQAVIDAIYKSGRTGKRMEVKS